jgi:hypothetical protein
VYSSGYDTFSTSDEVHWIVILLGPLRTNAVIHSAKRRKPRRLNEQAKAESSACQCDQVSVASVMVRLLCRDLWACQHPAGSDQEASLSRRYV